ncbi:hypothetical protein LAZ67_15001024 [Cordylochernes scorpioides]|uniref:Reverse transcriptase/retrotransposon-derived protein RNase H-like domain-containing protein n=1 Tax=Cordylochernes scorpioides TaxID=51811 RepID=A0ABY6L8R8_9ARAC|nr:hypothetical protein LAZ67_15001024 [Cordylochernes scorpioides]
MAYNTEEQHLLGCLREYNLTINETKYTLGQTWVKFLGFVITNAGNWLDFQRVQAIKDIPILDTLGKLLDMLISTRLPTKAFEDCKHQLENAALLHHPAPEAQLCLTVDALDFTINTAYHQSAANCVLLKKT